MNLPKSIVIVGRRWFQRTYGNTYFSAVAYLDGKQVAQIDFEYGYGDHYADEMTTKLENLDLIPKRVANPHNPAPWRHFQDLGIEFSYTATDVNRKKDL